MDKEQFEKASCFCWNKACADYGKVNKGNIRGYGKARSGVQRYQCKTCKATFTKTKGTIFYGCHTPVEKILECLAMVAEHNSLEAIHRVKGVKAETVSGWMQKAAKHVNAIEEVLLSKYHLEKAQMDALWTYVGHKGEKGGGKKRRSEGHFGEAPS